MADQLITIPEICELLGLKKSAVYALLQDGTIPCSRVGRKKGRFRVERGGVETYRKYRIERQAVEKYIQDNAVGGKPCAQRNLAQTK